MSVAAAPVCRRSASTDRLTSFSMKIGPANFPRSSSTRGSEVQPGMLGASSTMPWVASTTQGVPSATEKSWCGATSARRRASSMAAMRSQPEFGALVV